MKTKAPLSGVIAAALAVVMPLVCNAQNPSGVIVEGMLKADDSVVCESEISTTAPIAWQESAIKANAEPSQIVVKPKEKDPEYSQAQPKVEPKQSENLLASIAPVLPRLTVPFQSIPAAQGEINAFGKIFLSFLGVNFLLFFVSHRRLHKEAYPKHYYFHSSNVIPA